MLAITKMESKKRRKIIHVHLVKFMSSENLLRVLTIISKSKIINKEQLIKCAILKSTHIINQTSIFNVLHDIVYIIVPTYNYNYYYLSPMMHTTILEVNYIQNLNFKVNTLSICSYCIITVSILAIMWENKVFVIIDFSYRRIWRYTH